ncbi:hypothetical protein BDV32DRAFT_116950 [Aspergillus pseudonomiae]|nr:hypothetical protein BDV32DRAFT_116950 [Aspergillus pseudonomiae]
MNVLYPSPPVGLRHSHFAVSKSLEGVTTSQGCIALPMHRVPPSPAAADSLQAPSKNSFLGLFVLSTLCHLRNVHSARFRKRLDHSSHRAGMP